MRCKRRRAEDIVKNDVEVKLSLNKVSQCKGDKSSIDYV